MLPGERAQRLRPGGKADLALGGYVPRGGVRCRDGVEERVDLAPDDRTPWRREAGEGGVETQASIGRQEQLTDGLVWGRRLWTDARPQHVLAAQLGTGRELGDEPALADARRRDDRHSSAAEPLEPIELGATAEERGAQRAEHGIARRLDTEPDDRARADGIGLSL